MHMIFFGTDFTVFKSLNSPKEFALYHLTRCFDLCWDRTLHLWVYELKYKCLLKVIVLIHHMATPKISRSCYWALLITAKPFSCTQHIRYCLMVGILGGIMPFMIIPWILIDTLFDQKKDILGGLEFQDVRSCKIRLIRNAFSVFKPSLGL